VPSLGTILLVDDNQNDIDLLLRTFRQLHIDNPVQKCRSGKDAIKFLSDSANARPEVVLLDLKMPGTDGFEVLRWIKGHSQLKDLIVIVLTTSEDTYDIQRAYLMGANSFLTKPLNLEDFNNLISSFHQYWMVSNRPVPSSSRPPNTLTPPPAQRSDVGPSP
jgi:two-component system response regulator